MVKKSTYYAIVNDFSDRSQPRAVLRRVEDDEGQNDEVFSRDLTWEFSDLLYAAERGDTMNDFVLITEEEAMRIVDRIRREAGASD
jgi:hypothetical protein